MGQNAKVQAAPKDVLTTKATQATACRGRWSQCGGKNQQVSETWHICHADTKLREEAMAAGFTRPGVKGEKRTRSAAPAPEPKGLSASKAGKTAPQKAKAPTTPPAEERSHKPPQSVLSQPVSRVAGTANAATAQLLAVSEK